MSGQVGEGRGRSGQVESGPGMGRVGTCVRSFGTGRACRDRSGIVGQFGQLWTCPDRSGQVGSCQDMSEQVVRKRTGRDWSGQVGTGLDISGQDRN